MPCPHRSNYVYLQNAGCQGTECEVIKRFSSFGRITAIFESRMLPGFFILEYKYCSDAEEAVKATNGKVFFNQRITTELVKIDFPKTYFKSLLSYEERLSDHVNRTSLQSLREEEHDRNCIAKKRTPIVYDAEFRHRIMKVFVRNLGPRVTELELKEVFSRFGRVTSIKSRRDETNVTFILEYKHLREAKSAVKEMNGKFLFGRRIKVELKRYTCLHKLPSDQPISGILKRNCRVKGISAVKKPGSEDDAEFRHRIIQLVVRNLRPQVTELALKEYFSILGYVTSVESKRDETNVTFVLEYKDLKEAKSAVKEMNGKFLFGSNIELELKCYTCLHKLPSAHPLSGMFKRRCSSAGKKPIAENDQSVAEAEETKCCICLDTEENEYMTYLKCGHSLHRKCASDWIEKKRTCPVCRRVVVKEGHDKVVRSLSFMDLCIFL